MALQWTTFPTAAHLSGMAHRNTLPLLTGRTSRPGNMHTSILVLQVRLCLALQLVSIAENCFDNDLNVHFVLATICLHVSCAAVSLHILHAAASL